MLSSLLRISIILFLIQFVSSLLLYLQFTTSNHFPSLSQSSCFFFFHPHFTSSPDTSAVINKYSPPTLSEQYSCYSTSSGSILFLPLSNLKYVLMKGRRPKTTATSRALKISNSDFASATTICSHCPNETDNSLGISRCAFKSRKCPRLHPLFQCNSLD